MKDPAEAALILKYQRENEINPEANRNLDLNQYDILKLRIKILWQNLAEPLVIRFYIYLFLSGFIPQFNDFTFYWSFNVIGVT